MLATSRRSATRASRVSGRPATDVCQLHCALLAETHDEEIPAGLARNGTRTVIVCGMVGVTHAMSIVLTSLAGLVAGAGHVFFGPDHLAAIATPAVDQRRKTWRVGLFWGIGHSGGMWVLAIVALSFREALPIDLMSSWGERLVGFVLVGIGLIGLRRLFAAQVHSHVHEHNGGRHAHIHLHRRNGGGDHRNEHVHSHSAIGIGTLHGLGGTYHLIGVLPALLLPSRWSACAYVVSYGIGSIVAMTAFSWVMGRIAHRLCRSGDRAYRVLLGGCCALSIAIGCYWCFMTSTRQANPSRESSCR